MYYIDVHTHTQTNPYLQAGIYTHVQHMHVYTHTHTHTYLKVRSRVYVEHVWVLGQVNLECHPQAGLAAQRAPRILLLPHHHPLYYKHSPLYPVCLHGS